MAKNSVTVPDDLFQKMDYRNWKVSIHTNGTIPNLTADADGKVIIGKLRKIYFCTPPSKAVDKIVISDKNNRSITIQLAWYYGEHLPEEDIKYINLVKDKLLPPLKTTKH